MVTPERQGEGGEGKREGVREERERERGCKHPIHLFILQMETVHITLPSTEI